MNTPKLDIYPTLPVLAFNFDQLKAWATALTERYDNLVVTEDAIADVKRDMAELNKTKKAIDDARKEAVRQVSEPIRSFEAQIKEVCGIFDSAYAALNKQVKRFEDQQREEKCVKVKEIVDQLLADMPNFHDGTRLGIGIDERWLNKTTSLKSVREDVQAIIQKSIENDRREVELEQARRDRAMAIESHVKALNQRYGFDVPVSNFLSENMLSGNCNMNLNNPLADILGRISTQFETEAARREEQAKKAADASASPTPVPEAEQDDPATEQPIHSQENRFMSIVLKYDADKESLVLACIERLKEVCISFGARYRQD